MAHVKVIVGALLACAIVAHGFPAGEDSGVNRPLPGAFLPADTINRPTVAPVITLGVTPSRPVRDAEPDSAESKESKESHEQASSGGSTTVKTPARRDVTTPRQSNTPVPVRPLQGLQTTQSSLSIIPVKRDDDAASQRAGAKPGDVPVPSSPFRPSSGAKPGTTEEPSHLVTKREEPTTQRPFGKPALTTENSNQKNRRDATSTVSPGNKPAALPVTVPQKPTRQVTAAPPTAARPQPVRPLQTTGATPAGSRTKRQVSTSAPSAYPTRNPQQPQRPLPTHPQVSAGVTPPRPIPTRPLVNPANVPAGSRTKRDDDVFVNKPLDLQGSSQQGFPSQPSQPGQFGLQPSTQFSGFETSFSVPQNPSGQSSFGGISHGTLTRPDGSSSVSLSSVSSSSSRSRRDDGDYEDGEVDLS